jgi:hypothetical protein
MDMNKSIQMFYKNINEFSLDEDLDGDSELIMATTMLLHEHKLRPVHKGSVKGCVANVKRNREKGSYQLYWDYFHPTKPTYDCANIPTLLPDVNKVVNDYFERSEGI